MEAWKLIFCLLVGGDARLVLYRHPEEAEKEDRERWVIYIVLTNIYIDEHISWELRFSISLPLEPMCQIKFIVSLDFEILFSWSHHQL